MTIDHLNPNSRFSLARDALWESCQDDLRDELGREPTEDEIQRRFEYELENPPEPEWIPPEER